MYITRPKQLKPWKIDAVVGSIMLVVNCFNDFKVAQIIKQCSLIRELMFYEFELSHNTAQVTKNTFCTKIEGVVDSSKVNKWLKKFLSDCKNLDDQARSDGPKPRIPMLCSKPLSKSGE